MTFYGKVEADILSLIWSPVLAGRRRSLQVTAGYRRATRFTGDEIPNQAIPVTAGH